MPVEPPPPDSDLQFARASPGGLQRVAKDVKPDPIAPSLWAVPLFLLVVLGIAPSLVLTRPENRAASQPQTTVVTKVTRQDVAPVTETAALPTKGAEKADAFEAVKAAIRRDDEDAAIRILLPLAEQGNAEAQFQLGEAYYLLKKQDTAGLKWFRQAADKGHASAMYFLGNMHNNGDGVHKDNVEALKWYTLAASQAGPRKQGEMDTLNMAIQNRDGLDRKMSPAQIAEAQKLAREWSTQHKIAVPDPNKVASEKPRTQDNCSTAGQFKTCTRIEPWGTLSIVTDLRATQRVDGVLQNISGVKMTFDDAKKEPESMMAMIGAYMMIVLPSSTQDQRGALFEQIVRAANTSSVRAYEWTWKMNPEGPNPGRSVTFSASKTN